jgi:SEC-C motif-containing protein
MSCPCGSGLELSACCGPIIDGSRFAATPEALMRSRYSAYALQKTEHILATHDPETRDDVDDAATRDWAARTTWQSLEIVDSKDGGPNDDHGEVEFIARFADEKGRELSHHERSTFVRREGRWYFVDGVTPKQAPQKRSEPKVGRNEPCPCGSGKKYKKCHGR